MTHIGLFEGIGGFSLAARWMGWETIAWCEWNSFCQTALKYHFPEAEAHGDITKTDFTKYANRVDILTGGFPCQPYSVAGKRLGKEDERHLWPEMLRAIREIKPTWVVGENVLGIVNWNGGLVFDEVQSDLEAEGYQVQAFVLPACGVNAPHRRDRVWFVAHAISDGYELRRLTKNRPEESKSQIEQKEWERVWANSWGISDTRNASYTYSQGLPQRLRSKWGSDKKKDGTLQGCSIDRVCSTSEFTTYSSGFRRIQINSESESKQPKERIPSWREFPTQPPIRSRDDGFSSRLVGITVPRHRNESIKAYGNAIVPQVAHQIFKAIEQYNLAATTELPNEV